jgi:uncharacterized protein (UPF0335 family)
VLDRSTIKNVEVYVGRVARRLKEKRKMGEMVKDSAMEATFTGTDREELRLPISIVLKAKRKSENSSIQEFSM